VGEQLTPLRVAMYMPERSLLEAVALGLSKYGLPPAAGAFTGQTALVEAVARRQAEFVVIGAPSEGTGAVSLARALRARRPAVRIAVLMANPDAATIRAAHARELDAVLLTSAPLAEIANAIRRVAAGERIVPPLPERQLPYNSTVATLHKLSPRQRDVLELLASGHSNDEVADQLNLSVNTVKYHVRGLYRRLGVHTRAQATRALVERREHVVT
jgi:DNA-binding NarL/FixJ family response regulator